MGVEKGNGKNLERYEEIGKKGDVKVWMMGGGNEDELVKEVGGGCMVGRRSLGRGV